MRVASNSIHPRIIAIVSAYNEADVLEYTTRDLIAQGVEVFLLDDASTDGTADTIRPLLGHGVVAIERVEPLEQPASFALERILRAKTRLAESLDAAWFINHDADELRESPWLGVSLADAIALVDNLGWSAIDFEPLTFWPTSNDYRPGGDLRASFSHFVPAADVDRPQIRCWKRQPKVDILSSGGHEAIFDGRSVFPIRFLLRHYPVRSQTHGERKIFIERVPRFDRTERGRGWHVQYDDVSPSHRFVRDESTMLKYDAVAVRAHLALRSRAVEDADRRTVTALEELIAARAEDSAASLASERLIQISRTELQQSREEVERLCREAAEQQAGVRELATQCDSLRDRLAAASNALAESNGTVASLNAEIRGNRLAAQGADEARQRLEQQVEAMSGDLHAAQLALRDAIDREQKIRSSVTWRWTALPRSVVGWFVEQRD